MKRFLLSVIALVAVICSVLSCKKQFSDPEESLDSLRLINQVGNLSIDLNEIINELPKTALYNAGENAKAYLGKAQWQYTNEGLIVRIPLKLDSATYLYALKSYNNPQEVTVYIAKYKPVQSNYNKFTGTFIWLNLKDGYVYGTKYVNDSAAETLTPIAALNPDFEACAVEHRYFEMSPSTGEIKLKDSLNFLVDPQDCNQPNGRGGNFWNGLKRFFSDFDGVLGDIFGTGGGSAGPKWNPFEPSSPEWGGDGGSGHSSGGGGGGWSGGGGGGSGGGAPLTGGGDPLEFGDGPGMPYTIELPDTSGFLPSRKTALEVYVQSKPYGMLDCNDIESLEGFLPFIQDIASYEPAVAVTNRIDSIIDAIPEYNTFNTYIQNIENGEGVVNLDIFAVLIDSFPKNTDSIRMTPLEFLERFRKSLSPDFTTGGPTSFAPYKHILSGWFTIFDDGSFWRDDEKSLGAWININIPLNSGSVVISDYEIDPINDHYWFTFTTMTTQKDGRHPVCGNRRFGLMPHQDGGWQFYISGADRVWLWHEAMINEYSDGYFGFDKADALWTLIRNNVKAFVNNTGGIASDLPPGSIKVRIQWEGAVKDFLLGNITLEELKTALNCP